MQEDQRKQDGRKETSSEQRKGRLAWSFGDGEGERGETGPGQERRWCGAGCSGPGALNGGGGAAAGGRREEFGGWFVCLFALGRRQ